MNSIHEVFSGTFFSSTEQIAVLICKRKHSAYERNRKWLPSGLTGWWPVAETRQIDGIIILLESKHENIFEIWGGLSKAGGARIKQRNSDGRWLLGVDDSFEFLGLMNKTITTKQFLGKQPGTCVTYIQTDIKTGRENRPSPISSKPKPKFSPEFSGDRVVKTCGEHTAKSEHGNVMTALHRWLLDNGYKNLDNCGGYWDLYGISKKGVPYLFELKTSASTTDVYTGVGQLFIYNLNLQAARKVLILPLNSNSKAWQGTLKSVGVIVWFYRLLSEDCIEFFEK